MDVTESLLSEPKLSITQAARLPELQLNGRAPHVATLMRWSAKGIGPHRLETAKVGGRRVTSRAAVRRFLERVSQPALEPAGPTPIDRRRQIEEAEAELRAAGF